MSTPLPTVDVERLLIDWLIDRSEVTSIFDNRVYSELPANKDDWPAARLTLVDESAANVQPLYLTDSLIQFDVWGGPKVLARQGADAIRAVLPQARGTHVLGIIGGFRFGTYGYLPDTTFKNARPRYVFQVHVFAHPDVPSGS